MLIDSYFQPIVRMRVTLSPSFTTYFGHFAYIFHLLECQLFPKTVTVNIAHPKML